jgi:thiol:disulfide interchange protein
MARLTRLVRCGLLAAVAVGGCGDPGVPSAGHVAGATPPPTALPELLWAEDWDQCLDLAEREQRLVVALFVDDWCVWCRMLESSLADPELQAVLARRAVLCRVDVAGDGQQLASQLAVSRLPTVVVLSADGEERGRFEGFTNAAGFLDKVSPLLAS